MAGFCVAILVIMSVFLVFLLLHLVHSWNSTTLPSPTKYNRECKSVPPLSRDRRKNKHRLRLVTLNAEWLYLYGGSGGLKCPGTQCTWKTPAQARSHLQRVQHVLRQLDGDVVNVVEVEDCRVLGELADTPGNSINGGMYRPYLTRSTDRALGQNVGMLTRIDPLQFWRSPLTRQHPIKNSTCPRGQSGRTSLSKHYLARLPITANLTVTVIGVHLIAMPDVAGRCAKREAQAAIIQQLVRSAHPRDEIIVLGDFNDYDHDCQQQDSMQLKTPVLRMIKMADRRRPLRNVAHRLPRNKRWSAWWDKNGNCRMDGDQERTLIDHILVTPRLYGMIDKVFIAHRMYKATCRVDERVSDHWPIVVDLKV